MPNDLHTPPQSPSDVGIQHKTRVHISRDYIFPADDNERIRLNLQYKTIKAAFDNRLVLAPVTLKPGDCVLDSGTGTGSWAMDVANEVPSTVSIYGVDISDRLFPADPPSNVKFVVGSITGLPNEWTSTFTYINQRLLFGGLTVTTWKATLLEMYRVLTPGGWITLCEPNADLDRVDFKYGPATKKMWILMKEIFRSAGALADAAYHLEGWLEEAGFTNIRVEVSRMAQNGEEGKPMRELLCRACTGMKSHALRVGGLGLVHSEEEYDDMVQAYGEELEVTDNAAQLTYMVSAQKPAVP